MCIEQIIEVASSVTSLSTSGAHKPPSHRTPVQARGTGTTLSSHVEIVRGKYATGGGARKCSKDSRPLGPVWALLHWSRHHPGISQVTCSRWNFGMIPMYQSISFQPVSSSMRKVQADSVVLFTDYQFTAQNDEYLDPARYQCRGFSVLLDATVEGDTNSVVSILLCRQRRCVDERLDSRVSEKVRNDTPDSYFCHGERGVGATRA